MLATGGYGGEGSLPKPAPGRTVRTWGSHGLPKACQNQIPSESGHLFLTHSGTVWPPKTHPKFHSIFEGIWTPKMVPKASQNDAKIHKKCMFFPGVFSYRFFFNFGRFFGRFSRRPTLDFTAIYNEFVGCAFFRKV